MVRIQDEISSTAAVPLDEVLSVDQILRSVWEIKQVAALERAPSEQHFKAWSRCLSVSPGSADLLFCPSRTLKVETAPVKSARYRVRHLTSRCMSSCDIGPTEITECLSSSSQAAAVPGSVLARVKSLM